LQRTTTATGTLVQLDPDPNVSGPNSGQLSSGQSYLFQITPQQILFDPNSRATCPDGTVVRVKPGDLQMRGIVVRIFSNPAMPTESTTSTTKTWEFKYDTIAPPAPTAIDALAGENDLTVEWVAPGVTGDIDSYTVVYCPDVSNGLADASVNPDAASTDA